MSDRLQEDQNHLQFLNKNLTNFFIRKFLSLKKLCTFKIFVHSYIKILSYKRKRRHIGNKGAIRLTTSVTLNATTQTI